MIPVIEQEIVTKKKWLETKEITDAFAMAGSVPGAIAINSATFVGYRLAGKKGAVAATVGVMIPTFFIVLCLGVFYAMFKENPKVEAAFEGIRPAVVALITYAAIKLKKSSLIDKTTASAFVLSVMFLFFLNVHPISVILAGGLAGVLIIAVQDKLGRPTKIDSKEQNPEYFMGANI